MKRLCGYLLALLAAGSAVPGAMAQGLPGRSGSVILAQDRSREGRASLRGKIRQIDRDDKTMRVEAPGGTVQVKWDEDTDWDRDSKRSGPKDFFVGEEVRIYGRRVERDEIKARRIVWGGRPGYREGAVGEVVSIDRRAREMEIDFDGEVWTVRYNRSDLRKGDDRKEVGDLRRGQYVRVHGEPTGKRRVDARVIHIVRETDQND